MSEFNEKDRRINLKEYAAPEHLSDAQISEIIYSKVSQCPAIKSVAPNPRIGIAKITGKYCNYPVEHKHGRIHVRPKVNYGISVILSAFSLPFALWFVNAFDIYAPFKNYILPFSLILISFGAAWLVGYILGDKEQKTILSYIYNILRNIAPGTNVRNTKGLGTNMLVAIVPFVAGIAFLALYFVI